MIFAILVDFRASPFAWHLCIAVDAVSPRTKAKNTYNMAQRVFTTIEGPDISDTMLLDAATLFSNHYGIWGHLHAKVGKLQRTRSSI